EADSTKASKSAETKDQTGEQVAEGDAIEHAHQPDVGPGVAEAAVIKNSEEEQYHSPSDDAADRGASPDSLDGFAQGEDEGNAEDEDEQREDQIVEGEPLPVLVLQLIGHDASETGT